MSLQWFLQMSQKIEYLRTLFCEVGSLKAEVKLVIKFLLLFKTLILLVLFGRMMVTAKFTTKVFKLPMVNLEVTQVFCMGCDLGLLL